MLCPACSNKLKVVETVRNDEEVYRRKRCTVCGKLVFTLESEVEPDSDYRNNWLICDHNNRIKSKEENK